MNAVCLVLSVGKHAEVLLLEEVEGEGEKGFFSGRIYLLYVLCGGVYLTTALRCILGGSYRGRYTWVVGWSDGRVLAWGVGCLVGRDGRFIGIVGRLACRVGRLCSRVGWL